MRLFDLLFPKLCLGCGRFGTYLCVRCTQEIAQSELVCPNCEKPSIGGGVHPICKRKYGLDGLWSLGIYQDPLKKGIQKLKYKFVFDLGETLINLLIEYWAKYQPLFLEEIIKNQGVEWVVVPVPLHTKRQKWRGFNQAALLGQILSKKLGLEYLEGLKRVKYTKPQVGLKGYQRKLNIKNAFILNSKIINLKSNILLVDDVWTTGSTLKECCYVLKRGGAKKVWAITLAR